MLASRHIKREKASLSSLILFRGNPYKSDGDASPKIKVEPLMEPRTNKGGLKLKTDL